MYLKSEFRRVERKCLSIKSFYGMQRETHVGSYLFLWQMFSNIKMKYLVVCAKPFEDKFLAPTMRQNSIHLQFFIIASVLLLLVSDIKLSDPVCLFIWNIYPWKNHEVPKAHTQAYSATAYTCPTEQNSLYTNILPIYSPKMI